MHGHQMTDYSQSIIRLEIYLFLQEASNHRSVSAADPSLTVTSQGGWSDYSANKQDLLLSPPA
jgi:hypothetical protein